MHDLAPRSHHTLCLFAMLVPALLAASPSRAESLNNSELGFRLDIPDDFNRADQLAAIDKSIMAAFQKSAPDGPATLLFVERLSAMLPHERLDLSMAPPGFNGRVLAFKWNGFTVDAIEMPTTFGKSKLIQYSVQVPLSPKAIQLRIVGPADDAEQLRTLVQGLLSNLTGKTNWKTPAQQAAAASNGTTLIIVLGVLMLLGLVALSFLSRHLPRGTVLALAVFLFVISGAIKPGNSAAMNGIAGALRLFSVAAFLLGLVDIFRRRAV